MGNPVTHFFTFVARGSSAQPMMRCSARTGAAASECLGARRPQSRESHRTIGAISSWCLHVRWRMLRSGRVTQQPDERVQQNRCPGAYRVARSLFGHADNHHSAAPAQCCANLLERCSQGHVMQRRHEHYEVLAVGRLGPESPLVDPDC